MGDDLEFIGKVLEIFVVFCLFYHYIGHNHAWRDLLGVHEVAINY
jgi:hypothetical protein